MSIQQENQSENLPWEYGVYQQLFEETSDSFTPAYMHGLAWATLITVGDKGMMLIPFFQKLTSEELGLFKKLIDASAAQMHDQSIGISLLLPEDSAPLSYRLEALVDWCEGLIQGIQLADTVRSGITNIPSVHDIMLDIEEIAALQCDEVSTEENERHYQELVEFMRVAVLLLESNVNEPQAVVQEDTPILH